MVTSHHLANGFYYHVEWGTLYPNMQKPEKNNQNFMHLFLFVAHLTVAKAYKAVPYQL